MDELFDRAHRATGRLSPTEELRRGDRQSAADISIPRLLATMDEWRSSIGRRLATIVQQIEGNANGMGDWETLHRHVRNAFPAFYDKMKRCSPPLTPTETKVFLLIGLNISSDESAMLLRCTRGTILKHRSSIRKKMHMSHEEKLK